MSQAAWSSGGCCARRASASKRGCGRCRPSRRFSTAGWWRTVYASWLRYRSRIQRAPWPVEGRGRCCPWRTHPHGRTPGDVAGQQKTGAHRSPRPFSGHPPGDGQARRNAPPPLQNLHPKALEVMKAPPRACYNFVTLGPGYDKRDGPWTRALVDRARRGTPNVVGAARRACRTAVLRSLSRRAPPQRTVPLHPERIQLLDPVKRGPDLGRVRRGRRSARVAHADALEGPGMRLPALCRRPAPARLPRRGRGRRGGVSTPPDGHDGIRVADLCLESAREGASCHGHALGAAV
jgi:hypothetical protein